MSEPSLLSQIAKIRNIESGHRAAQILNTGFRSGILGALAEFPEGMTIPELALKLMLYVPYVKIWCQTAYYFDLLDGDDKGRFKLQLFLKEALGLDRIFDDFSTLKENREGPLDPPGMPDDPYLAFMRTGCVSRSNPSRLVSFAVFKATQTISTIFYSMVFPEYPDLEKPLKEGCSLLDIGCGSGQLLLDFAGRFPNSRFVGTDPDPYGIEIAEEAITLYHLESRIRVENQGGEEIQFSAEFDLALLVLTLHEIQPDLRQEVLRRIFNALKKGGRLLILDYPYPGCLKDFRNPRFEYGIMEQYFEAIAGIIHLSASEQDDLIAWAGFGAIHRTAIGDGGMLDLIIALK